MNTLLPGVLALLPLAAAAQTPPPSSVLTPEKLWQRVFFDWLGRTLKPDGQAAR